MSFYSSTSSYASSSHVTSKPSKSFKKVIRPFLRACHPDAMMGASTEQTADDIAPSTTHHGKRTRPLSQQAKETNNLKAVQEYTMGQQQRKQIDQWNLSDCIKQLLLRINVHNLEHTLVRRRHYFVTIVHLLHKICTTNVFTSTFEATA